MKRLPRALLLSFLCVVSACARSGEPDASGSDVSRPNTSVQATGLPGLFGGFHLLAPRDSVLAAARLRGLGLECGTGEHFDMFCSQGLEPPPGKPDLSFGFRDGRLVSLVRSYDSEGKSFPVTRILEVYHREFGEPVLSGALNPYIHARLWVDGDTTRIGMLTCEDPEDGGTCDLGLDYVPGTRLARMIEDYRRMMQEASRQSGTRPSAAPAAEPAPYPAPATRTGPDSVPVYEVADLPAPPQLVSRDETAELLRRHDLPDRGTRGSPGGP